MGWVGWGRGACYAISTWPIGPGPLRRDCQRVEIGRLVRVVDQPLKLPHLEPVATHGFDAAVHAQARQRPIPKLQEQRYLGMSIITTSATQRAL